MLRPTGPAALVTECGYICNTFSQGRSATRALRSALCNCLVEAQCKWAETLQKAIPNFDLQTCGRSKCFDALTTPSRQALSSTGNRCTTAQLDGCSAQTSRLLLDLVWHKSRSACDELFSTSPGGWKTGVTGVIKAVGCTSYVTSYAGQQQPIKSIQS